MINSLILEIIEYKGTQRDTTWEGSVLISTQKEFISVKVHLTLFLNQVCSYKTSRNE
jgi:hypothetical protein